MVIKLYVSRLSGSMEIKTQQDFIERILDSYQIPYSEVDITDPLLEDERDFMREHARILQGHKYPLPPQVFNDNEYCGDYDSFYLANEDNKLLPFLKLGDGDSSFEETTLNNSNLANMDLPQEVDNVA